MLPIMSNDLGKDAMREVMSLVALIPGSGMMVLNKGLGSAIFRSC